MGKKKNRKSGFLFSILHDSYFTIHCNVTNGHNKHQLLPKILNNNALRNQGQAALTAVIFFLVAAAAIGIGFTTFAFEETATARRQLRAKQSYFLAEAGAEDVAYRLHTSKQTTSPELLTINGETVSTAITSSGGVTEIISSGNYTNNIRKVKMSLVPGSTGANFYYGVQVGAGGLEMGNNAVVNGNVYSNGSITGNNGATIMGDVIVAGGLPASPSLEWTTHNTDQFFATASSNRDIAQSFTAPASSALNQVSVYLGKVGNPTSNITVRITNDDTGEPDTSALSSATLSYASVGVTPSWINVTFASPATLTNGTKYWIVLDYGSNSATDHWNWRKDSTDTYANNTGRYTSNWSAGGSSWTNVGGDLAFRVWTGGTVTSIGDIDIGNSTSGTGRANQFIGTTIHGSNCPNAYCIIDNPSPEALPISDGVIQDWKNAAEAGGITAGDVAISGTQTIGPRKITGKLTVTNGSTLTVNGTLWVMGDIVFDNNSIIRLSSSYGMQSGVVISDSKIDVKNGAAVSGSGNPSSFIMLLDAKDSIGEETITVDNNSTGVIYYAGKSWIKFSNLAAAKEATAYGTRLDNNATITYDSGLANAQFASGPSGGWDITTWREVE